MAPQLRSRRHFLSTDSNMPRALKAPKMGKKSCKTEENGGEDRLSDLPDAIICHILSFLDTKYAVATSVLSTRWKHLFVYVPNIILDNSLTRKTSSVGVDQEFAMFGLRQVMLRKVPYVNQFRLNCNFSFDDPVIETLVRTVVWRHVKEIDISIGEVEPIGSLPCELFMSTSLVVLKLKGTWTEDETYLVVPELVCLPNLKVLHVDGFFIESGLNRLFQGCEFLEDLCLRRCEFWEVEVLDISLPCLRKLSFNHGDNWAGEYTSMTFIRLVLDTPNLEFFEYKGHIGSLEVKKLMPHARAEFELPEWEDTEDYDDAKNAFPSINSLRGIKSLYLSKDSLELMYPLGAIPSASQASVFETLTLLELGFYDLRMLPCILACAPELETLIIREHDYVDYVDFKAIYPLPETVPVCLANNLSNIEFRDFVLSKHEFELMKYLLQNGKVLRSMIISGIDRGCKESSRKSIHKKLKMLSRFSETCEIVLDY